MSISGSALKDIAAIRVLSRRETGTYGETISRLIGEVCATLAPRNGRAPACSVTGPIMTFYHDSEYREQDADLEVALPVA